MWAPVLDLTKFCLKFDDTFHIKMNLNRIKNNAVKVQIFFSKR